MACDRPQHVSRLGQEPSLGVGDVHRVDAQSEAPQLVLEARPLGNLVPLLGLRPPRRLRGRVDRRHPDDPGALTGGDLDGEGVHASHRPVEGQRADDLDVGEQRRDDLRSLGGRRVVRLEGEPREPELGEALSERAIVDPPLGHVRSHVDVQVVRALHESPGTVAGRRHAGLSRGHRVHPNRRPPADWQRARREPTRSPRRCAARSRARAAARAPLPSRPRGAPRGGDSPRRVAREAVRR